VRDRLRQAAYSKARQSIDLPFLVVALNAWRQQWDLLAIRITKASLSMLAADLGNRAKF
jgi:hypothetical protein